MKGLFTQGLVVLCEDLPTLDVIADVLDLVPGASGRRPGRGTWMEAEQLILPGWRGKGHVIVSVLDRQWPDGMGDPTVDPELFGAWTMGFFGPSTFPGGLRRAVEQAYAWPRGADVAPAHRCFVRVMTTYAVGTGPTDAVLPPDYDPRAELLWLTPLWRRLLDLPEALCAFAPGGEMLHDADSFDRALRFARQHEIDPVDLWTNVRMWQGPGGWTVMDTVGLPQLDLIDQEACFRPDEMQPGEVAGWLRNVEAYLVETGNEIDDGDTMDGPGGPWRGLHAAEAMFVPSRPTVRWFPLSGTHPPDDLRPTAPADG